MIRVLVHTVLRMFDCRALGRRVLGRAPESTRA